MSYADYLFVTNCKNIMEDGISDEAFEVRPKWSDGTPAHTKKILYAHDSYDLRVDPIPAITLRKQFFKGCVDEILWIYQRQSNKLSELNSHVWDSWDIGDGTIGKAYGYQIAKLSKHHKYRSEDYNELNSGFYGNFKIDPVNEYVYLNQIGAVIWDLMHDPGSRRIMTNTYNHEDLTDMGLSPCAYSVMFNVTKNVGDDVPTLNAILYQRSQDMLTANGWNVMQYAALVQMIAHVVGMRAGRFDHMVADMHIYDRHIPVVKELCDALDERYADELTGFYNSGTDKTDDLFGTEWTYPKTIYDAVPYSNPGLWINPDIKSFFEFTPDDLKLTDYKTLPFNHKIGNGPGCDIEVAV